MIKKKTKRKTKPKKKSKVIKKKKIVKKGLVFKWYFPFLVLFILFFSFLSFLLFLFSNNYKNWEKEFLNSEVLFLDFKNENLDLDEKISEYNRVEGEYAFIELTQEESLFLFSNALSESLPDWIEIQKTGLVTSEGEWIFYIKSNAWNISLPWFGIFLFKENIQSIDIYIEDIFLGDFSSKNFGLYSILEKSNSGLERAIKLVNDGNFAGRIFENIELGQESLIIKSRNTSSF